MWLLQLRCIFGVLCGKYMPVLVSLSIVRGRSVVDKFFKTTLGSSYIFSMFFKASCRSRLKAEQTNVIFCKRSNFSESVRGVRGAPFQAGFSDSVRRVEKGLKLNYVSSCRTRPLVIHSRRNACTLTAISGVGGVSRLARRVVRGKDARFLRVDNNSVGTARLITALVGRGSGLVRKVHCTRREVSNALALLLLAPSNLCYTHSELKEAPMIVNEGRSNCYTIFRSYSCLGLRCRSSHRLNPKRVTMLAPRKMGALITPKGSVHVYAFL